MTLVDSIRTCFQKYFDFSGRASRSEFWWFFLCATIAQWVVGIFLPGILFLLLVSPFLAVSARRLHDTGRSAWWLLSYLVSGVAIIVLAVAGFVLAFAGEDIFSEFDFEDAEFVTLAVILLFGLLAGLAASLLPLVLCALPGTVGPNRFGDDPLSPPPESGTVDLPPIDPVAHAPPIEREADKPRFCAQCGSSLDPGAKFCASCGAAV
ncbi:MAG: DUF805 domain-containing protein [Chloroflexi bacterium]|nr:DUF805 domain-containing protein [Chloroflexota bacterium]